MWDSQLQTRFGIDANDWEAMFAAQDGRCAICGREQKEGRLAVDHDHVTNKVRKLLCRSCNRNVAIVEGVIQGLSPWGPYLAYLTEGDK